MQYEFYQEGSKYCYIVITIVDKSLVYFFVISNNTSDKFLVCQFFSTLKIYLLS